MGFLQVHSVVINLLNAIVYNKTQPTFNIYDNIFGVAMKNSIFVIILTHISLVLMYSRKWGLHFVGGMAETYDKDILETVERETLEEAQIKLSDRTKFKHLLSREVLYTEGIQPGKYKEDVVLYELSEADLEHIPRFNKRKIESLVSDVEAGRIKEFVFRIDRKSIDLDEISDLFNMKSKESGVYSYVSTELSSIGVENTVQCIQLYNEYEGVDLLKQKVESIQKAKRYTQFKIELEDSRSKDLSCIEILSDTDESAKLCPIMSDCICHQKWHYKRAYNEVSMYKKLKHLYF